MTVVNQMEGHAPQMFNVHLQFAPLKPTKWILTDKNWTTRGLVRKGFECSASSSKSDNIKKITYPSPTFSFPPTLHAEILTRQVEQVMLRELARDQGLRNLEQVWDVETPGLAYAGDGVGVSRCEVPLWAFLDNSNTIVTLHLFVDHFSWLFYGGATTESWSAGCTAVID
ncbi:hypothetical protein BCR35DRAFT_333188 [Leucosporidium creatinivorum]|uniref:Uncharacterized protein n=1 Tax=Leucosporidium creatinivorum TaxID=106004 RepID=A0A1Y2EUN9_9BASI|nr:hypothetical protein BCR35DRAFT_333188 [Leucosporidium creatinivorum]